MREGRLLRTTDGGGTWAERRLGTPEHNLLAVGCAGGACFVLGDAGSPVYRTIDAGATWAAEATGDAGALDAISCLSATHCFVAGEGAPSCRR